MGFYLQGLTMGLAYVAPIGMQNLFVINSALTKTRRKAVFTAIIVTMNADDHVPPHIHARF